MAVDCNIKYYLDHLSSIHQETSLDMKQNLFRSTKQIRIQFSQNTSLYVYACWLKIWLNYAFIITKAVTIGPTKCGRITRK